MAAGAAVVGLGSALVKATLDAAKIENVEKTFTKLAASINTTSEALLGDMQKATRGMVRDSDLMQAANKFMAMGLASSAEEAANLAETATQLGMAMGEDATESMEAFALMMANQSIPRLDTFGISSGKVKARINELMEATEGLTREQAFNQAVMEQAEVTMARVGEQSGGMAGTMARLKASFSNIKNTIGKAFLPVAEKVLRWVADLVHKYGPMVERWFKRLGGSFSGSVGKMPEWLKDVVDAVKILLDGLREFWDKHGMKIKQILEGVWGWIQTNFKVTLKVISGLIKVFSHLINGRWDLAWQSIQNTVKEVWAHIVAWSKGEGKMLLWHITNTLQYIRLKWEWFWGMVPVWAKVGWYKFRKWYRAELVKVIKSWQGNLALMGQIWEDFYVRMGVLLVRAWQGNLENFRRIMKNIWVKMGVDFIQQWQKLPSWWKTFWLGMVRIVKNALGIHSPSKIFEGVGKDIVAGLAEGMAGGMTVPVDAMYNMSGAMAGSAAAGATQYVNIYGQHLHGIQNQKGWLAEMQGMMP